MPKVTLFATNLHNPSHMEWTNDGRLLVSGHSSGTVTDVTEGGDMQTAEPFAYGLKGPAAILPLPDGRILVTESWGGTIRDISKGGDVSKQKPFASGLSLPYSLVRVRRGDGDRLFASEDNGGRSGWISDVTRGGKRARKYISNLPSRPGMPGITPINSWSERWERFAAAKCIKDWEDNGDGNQHYIAVGVLGQIFDVTHNKRATDYSTLLKRKDTLIAWDLNRVGGIKTHPKTSQIYACEPEAGNIVKIDPKARRNYRFDPPVVRGLNFPTCVRFSRDGGTMYVCGQGDGVIWRITDFV